MVMQKGFEVKIEVQESLELWFVFAGKSWLTELYLLMSIYILGGLNTDSEIIFNQLFSKEGFMPAMLKYFLEIGKFN